MLKSIFNKSLSITLCLLILNLVVYGNTNSGFKKGTEIGMSVDNTCSLFSLVFGLEMAEETLPDASENSENRPQVSEEEVHGLFFHKSDICFRTPFANGRSVTIDKNFNPSSHIPEITPPPPKA